MNDFEDNLRMAERAARALPKDLPQIIPWAEENVVLSASSISKYFRVSLTPWLREPLEQITSIGVRIVTLMKPIQSGGSTFGEVLLLYWITFLRGFLQYNWSNDKRALERWTSRIKPLFEATPCVAERFARIVSRGSEADFGNVFFRMQGAFVSANLDSDTIPLQINEEIHDWEAGHMAKAEGRATMVWNFKRANISNAGNQDDQLDQAHKLGTNQAWEVKCPGCGQYHVMREKWEDKRPDLGGIRYDAAGCRRGNFDYDYNKLKPTLRYQFPCGFSVHNEDVVARRALSDSGRYGEPRNKGALLSNRSYWYDAASVDRIDFLTLVQEKHKAIRAMAYGDRKPFIKYQKERACVPYNINQVPTMNVTQVTTGLKKNRIGLESPRFRTFELDRQQGEAKKGELPHWWVLIRDFKLTETGLKSQLVFEDKIVMDQDVINVLKAHQCNMWQGVADSGDDTTYVYLFCIKHGINAVKGGKTAFYTHEDGSRKIYSAERPLHAMLNRPPLYDYIEMDFGGGPEMVPDPREPMFWLYSKHGIRERLHFLRGNTDYQTPEDVSEDYKEHQDAEERVEHVNPSDGSREWRWNQVKDRNDQFVNECYAAMMADKAGMITQTEKTE